MAVNRPTGANPHNVYVAGKGASDPARAYQRLTEAGFAAAFGTPGGKALTQAAVAKYSGPGEPTFWSAAQLGTGQVDIYLTKPELKVASVMARPDGMYVNGTRVTVVPAPNGSIPEGIAPAHGGPSMSLVATRLLGQR